MGPTSNKLVRWRLSQDRTLKSGCKVPRQCWFLLYDQNTILVWSVFLQHLDVPSEVCSRRGVKRQYRTRRLREIFECRATQRYQNHRHERIGFWSKWRAWAESISGYHLPSICSVNADFIYLFRILPKVFDMPEHMASAILADEVT